MLYNRFWKHPKWEQPQAAFYNCSTRTEQVYNKPLKKVSLTSNLLDAQNKPAIKLRGEEMLEAPLPPPVHSLPVKMEDPPGYRRRVFVRC